MTPIEQQKAARKFVADWTGKGYEKGESQKFWLDLLCNVFGVQDFASFISFEDQVKLDHTSFIDGYISATKVLIEQKSLEKDLRAPIKQSDGTQLNPFQQAKRYITELPVSKHPRWVVTCNFKSFLVYDMEQPNGEPEEILLENLEKEFYRLSFLTDTGSVHLQKELEISKKAGDIIGEIYDAILKQYKDAENPSPATLRSLNMLCVRIVFCLYAEDAGIFGHRSIFGDYLNSFEAKDLRRALLDLFQALDQKTEERDEYLEEALAAFPYVNGGLFTEQDRTIPPLTDDIKELLVKHASSEFDWSEISPTIFGAIFESTLNPETRRSGGMHYTSIENIHKVIDPLFLDDLKAEFETLKETKNAKAKAEKTIAFQRKLGSLKFLDPACGSGNFLTETYLSLRKLENECLRLRFDQSVLDVFEDAVFVQIHQFYGIEINDFAAVVAKTALWIAESQMMKETSDILQRNLDFLPLKSYANIVEGNALQMDWGSIGQEDTSHGDVGNVAPYDYILGNPPFVGYALQSKEQKDDLESLMEGFGKNIDYVAGWYYKAAQLMQGTKTRAALVSTNSITQGEQVAAIWKPMFERFGIHFDFAYRTFRWDSEANIKAHVHCVIIGFSCSETGKAKRLYLNETQSVEAQNINGYLLDAPDVFIEKRSKPICDVPVFVRGCQPTDDGNFILSDDEKELYLKIEPQGAKFLRPFMMGKDFIDRKPRWCFWLVGANPTELKECPILLKRIEAVREFRLKSSKAATRQKADTPMLFDEIREPKSSYIALPTVSSESRRYVPIDYLTHDIIPGNKIYFMENATLFHFGVLTSNVHMAWMRAVCGRLKSDYNYSNTIVYNNFPWPNKDAKIASSQSNTEGAKIASSQSKSEVGNFTSLNGEVGNFASLFLDKSQDVNEHRAHLPHWHQDGKLQFITFRLADSLPKEKIDELEQGKANFLKLHPKPWDKETERLYYKRFGSKIDKWLDAGMGSCLLKFPNIREIVCNALEFFDGKRYLLHSYVVMPNHVHVLVEMLGENKTSDVLHSWKRHTANQINKLIGESGSFWQHESYDRMIRDENHYNNVLRYIANNPRNLPENSYTLAAKIVSSKNDTEGAKIASSQSKSEVKNFTSLNGEVGNFASLIESTAQAILDARALYPDSSLADLYNETLMPPELRKAHQANDRAVMAAYGFSTKMTESECVAELFKMYEALAK